MEDTSKNILVIIPSGCAREIKTFEEELEGLSQAVIESRDRREKRCQGANAQDDKPMSQTERDAIAGLVRSAHNGLMLAYPAGYSMAPNAAAVEAAKRVLDAIEVKGLRSCVDVERLLYFANFGSIDRPDRNIRDYAALVLAQELGAASEGYASICPNRFAEWAGLEIDEAEVVCELAGFRHTAWPDDPTKTPLMTRCGVQTYREAQVAGILESFTMLDREGWAEHLRSEPFEGDDGVMYDPEYFVGLKLEGKIHLEAATQFIDELARSDAHVYRASQHDGSWWVTFSWWPGSDLVETIQSALPRRNAARIAVFYTRGDKRLDYNWEHHFESADCKDRLNQQVTITAEDAGSDNAIHYENER